MRAHRARLRERGLRPVTLWLPDTRSPELKAEAARQGSLAARADDEQEVMALIQSAMDWPADDSDVPDYR
ncbi:MAG TPA: antitoxin MazE family protein [Geminicoccaceae bacterium]|nr:antitoxin MazE family protein [Geminicoccaceae bacterium]